MWDLEDTASQLCDRCGRQTSISGLPRQQSGYYRIPSTDAEKALTSTSRRSTLGIITKGNAIGAFDSTANAGLSQRRPLRHCKSPCHTKSPFSQVVFRTLFLPSSMSVHSSIYNVLLVVMALLLMTPQSSVLAFNVDVKTAMVHEGQRGSMFGYAVAQHIDQSTNWLLIGAPRAQTSQPGVVRGGAVFRCKTDRRNSCQEIPFDDTGNILVKNALGDGIDRVEEEKSNQWFGMTIKSSGENGVIVACAPRYVYFSQAFDKREPIGRCFLAKTSTTKYEVYEPCRNELFGFNNHGYCQAGLSAALSQDGRKLLIGAPGSFYWQGRLFNYRTDEGGDKFISSTKERRAEDDDSFLGYASAIGEFDGDGVDDYVVGRPKGEWHLGRIEMYTQNMTLIDTLVGEQVGSYFGSAIAVTDLNGDRLDDIIVGAPMYADFSKGSIDVGRVYIYYQTSSKKFKSQKRDILDGTSSKSRFGMALSGISDINYDGYDDLCIGAPYAGEDKQGAVYIYHGSKKGIITDASQIIYAKDVGKSLSAFGISISGGWDQDDNQYPDMLIGAYESDKAVFLRTKPVVRVYASLKLQPDMINLESKSCSLADGTRVPCLTVYTCIEYNGVGVPEELFFDLTWTLDAKESNISGQEQRAYYTNSINKYIEKTTMKLMKKKTHCTQSYAYVKSDPGDKLSPIRATLDFKLNEDGLQPRRRRALPPILDAYIPTTTSFTAQIQKDCGPDNVCIPNLNVGSIRASGKHKIGSKASIEMLIIVKNQGEDSFNTKLWVNLPPGVVYDAISNQRSVVPISCGTLESDATVVVCDMGNPMEKEAVSEFTMNLTPTNANNTKDSFIFTFYVNSSNPEKATDYEDNYNSLDIPVEVEAEIVLFGKASPELIVLNTTDPRGKDVERRVTHVFQVKNQGQSAINETELQIRWPSVDAQGKPVLVLEGALKIEGNGKCSIIIITPKNASRYLGWHGSKSGLLFKEKSDRGKRETDSQRIACTASYCTIIQCLVGYMSPYTSFVLTINSRLNVRNFIQRRQETQMYHITSVAHARVRSVPYDFENVDVSKFITLKRELVTKVNTDRLIPGSKGVEMWVIAVAVTAGLLVLLLLILLLWWCGFFKRKKPEEEGYFVVNGKTDIDNKIVD